MYTNTESTVINNGNTWKFFILQRGVRQGCPLSAYLFIKAIEILIIKISNDSSIKGIKIGNNEIKISLLADDMTLLLQDLTSVNNVLNTLAYFLLSTRPIMDQNTRRNSWYINCEQF